MDYLTLIVDINNINDYQYQQALKIVNTYVEAKEKEIKERRRILENREINNYLLDIFKLIETNIVEKKKRPLLKIRNSEFNKPLKSRTIKPIQHEVDAQGKILYFNLNLVLSKTVITYLKTYFVEFKNSNLNPEKVSREDLTNINIYKFNRISDFKSQHVVTLVNFLNENKIPCSHRVEGKNKLFIK